MKKEYNGETSTAIFSLAGGCEPRREPSEKSETKTPVMMIVAVVAMKMIMMVVVTIMILEMMMMVMMMLVMMVMTAVVDHAGVRYLERDVLEADDVRRARANHRVDAAQRPLVRRDDQQPAQERR